MELSKVLDGFTVDDQLIIKAQVRAHLHGNSDAFCSQSTELCCCPYGIC